MGLVPIILVVSVGVFVTIFAAARMWRASRSGASREQLVGYMAIMVAASAVTLLVLRVL